MCTQIKVGENTLIILTTNGERLNLLVSMVLTSISIRNRSRVNVVQIVQNGEAVGFWKIKIKSEIRKRNV